MQEAQLGYTKIWGFAQSWLGRMFYAQNNYKRIATWPKISRTHLDIHQRNKIKGYNELSKAAAHTKERHYSAKLNTESSYPS